MAAYRGPKRQLTHITGRTGGPTRFAARQPERFSGRCSEFGLPRGVRLEKAKVLRSGTPTLRCDVDRDSGIHARPTEELWRGNMTTVLTRTYRKPDSERSLRANQ